MIFSNSVANYLNTKTESIVRDGKWFPIPGGAHIEQLKKGDIIFSAAQTEELIRTGKVISGGGHGRIAHADGTAYNMLNAYYPGSSGNGPNRNIFDITGSVSNSSSSSSSSNSNSNSNSNSSSDEAEEFEETLDWIERKIKDIERDIDNLDKTVSATYKSWSDRNSALTDEIALVNEEIAIQQQAYERYMQEANNVGLSDEYKKLVQEGKIDIETITDEDLANKISEYTEWYDKALECQDATQDLQDTLAELAKTRFEGVVTQFENIISTIEHGIEILEGKIDQVEAEGYLVSTRMYEDLAKSQAEQLAKLEEEYNSLQNALNTAMAEGNIVQYSEDWYELVGQIQDVESEIQSLNSDLIETNNTIQEIQWGLFDRMQEMLSTVQSESDFLIDLMSNDKMFDDDTAAITDQGRATLGLHALNYNAYMSQANDYANEIEKLNKEIAEDPNNVTLLERRQELIDSHREMISNAEDEKQAMQDLVSEGYDAFLSVMDEVIDKRKEMLQTTKDMYDYEKNVAEQVEEIARLEKQLQAYSGDTSESAKATVQKLKVSLEEARENLEETEYDRYIQDQEKMLDLLRDDTEEWMNERLDNLDLLIPGVIDATNVKADEIKTTLEKETASVGTTLSEAMEQIWSPEGKFAEVVTTYGSDFNKALTTTNNTLHDIRDYLRSMIADSNNKAMDLKPAESGSTNFNGTEGDQTGSSTGQQGNLVKGTIISAGGMPIYDHAGDTSGNKQYYSDDPRYTVLEERDGYVKVRHHSLSKGVTGWFKKSDIKAYKTGGLLDYTGLLWGDGTKSRPEMVLDARDTANFIELKDVLQRIDPQDLLYDRNTINSLRDSLEAMQASLISSIEFERSNLLQLIRPTGQDISVQIGDIQMYGVNDPETFAKQLKYTLQTNKSVKNIIQADTLGVMTGKNGLTKFKY